MQVNFKNQKVIVTGAAQGIGRAICDAFYLSGAEVIGTDIDKTSLDQVPQQTGLVDVTDPGAVQDFIDENTFVYFDPPYRPLNKTSSFTSYSKFEFTDEEQLKLAAFFKSMDKKSAKMLLSNSDPKNENPDDDFFEDAYQTFNIDRVFANRAINSKGRKRGKINELVITNYLNKYE